MTSFEELKTLLEIIVLFLVLAESPWVLAVTGVLAVIYLLLKLKNRN